MRHRLGLSCNLQVLAYMILFLFFGCFCCCCCRLLCFYIAMRVMHEMNIVYGGRCDRILWYGKEVKQLSYFRSESKFSDHRPVSAIFSTQIEVVKPTNPTVAALQPIAPTINPPNKTVRILWFCQGSIRHSFCAFLLIDDVLMGWALSNKFQ
uniref:Putative type I inositol 1,4,5-trisphosphate 5-phosphatase CVP2-like n=1 Tax=Davidia involucrata TaxID=16924 RepID=A0A5B7A746_DAVIN